MAWGGRRGLDDDAPASTTPRAEREDDAPGAIPVPRPRRQGSGAAPRTPRVDAAPRTP